jgi:hypothetical protein
MKKWKFEEELLSFLLPHMTDKPRVTSMDLSSDESRDSTAENRSAENTQATENTQASELVDNSVETPSRPLLEAIPTPTSSLKRNHPRQRQISGKKQSAPIPETSSSTLMKYILDQKKTTEQIQLKNGLDFFYGIKETVKAVHNTVRFFIDKLEVDVENIILKIYAYFSQSAKRTETLIVVFVLSAQNDCFLLAHENEFLVETVRSRLQTHS